MIRSGHSHVKTLPPYCHRNSRAAARELGLSLQDLPLAGLAKSRVLEEEKKSRFEVKHSPERVFLPGQKNAIALRPNRPPTSADTTIASSTAGKGR